VSEESIPKFLSDCVVTLRVRDQLSDELTVPGREHLRHSAHLQANSHMLIGYFSRDRIGNLDERVHDDGRP
jgi:hypothetical protein